MRRIKLINKPTYIYIYVCVCVCICIYICVCVCVYIYGNMVFFRNEGSGTVVLYRNFVSYRLRSCAVFFSQSRNSPHFMEPKGSLPQRQQLLRYIGQCTSLTCRHNQQGSNLRVTVFRTLFPALYSPPPPAKICSFKMI
jgi:hypothetical protein